MRRHWLFVWVLLVCAVQGGMVTDGHADPAVSPLFPDAQKTPGDVLTTDPQVVCTPGYSKTVRNVPQSVKNQVYRQYGILQRAPKEYEIDHLISLELGGSNSIRNLWPQSYVTMPLNARVKDALEHRLHALVCAGTLTLPDAQRAIATHWTTAYEQYVGPVPGGTSPQTTTTPGASAALIAAHPDGSCPATAPIKVSTAGIYHRPGGVYYARSKATTCAATEAAATAAGFRASQR